jgi:DNA polymerase-3 subunit delta
MTGVVKIIDDYFLKLKQENLDPIYFLCGEDVYAIEKFANKVIQIASYYLKSDLDKETFSLKDSELSEVLSSASSYPFDSEKKIIVAKDFKAPKDLKEFLTFVKNPPDFSIVIFIQKELVDKKDKEPYATLIEKGFFYEAKSLKSQSLVKWIISYLDENGKKISRDNAEAIIEIVGEDRSLIDSQLQKLLIYVGDKREITFDDIEKISSYLKEYTIFDLQKAIAKKDKELSFKYALNLLNNGADPLFILSMLNKYFTILSQIKELEKDRIPPKTAANMLGVREYFYSEYLAASQIFDDSKLLKISRALLNLDISLKSSSIDSKTAICILLAEILE